MTIGLNTSLNVHVNTAKAKVSWEVRDCDDFWLLSIIATGEGGTHSTDFFMPTLESIRWASLELARTINKADAESTPKEESDDNVPE